MRNLTHAIIIGVVVLAKLAISNAHGAPAQHEDVAAKLDLPIEKSWPARKAWDDSAEAQYGDFISTIGRAVAAGKCRTLSDCMNDPAINPLHETTAQALRFRADCADVPYILRAYFAYRHDLPFSYARTMKGRGHDARYYRDARPQGLRTWLASKTPRHLFQSLSSAVHSGFFRTAPAIASADFYQTTIDRSAVRSGTMFYDPNGHVLVVYAIRPDGEVLTFDGHPDGYLTHGQLTEKNERGGASQGGGFKNFRPITFQNGHVLQAENTTIAGFGGTTPFDRSRYQVGGRPVSFHAWVRAQLAADPTRLATR